MAWALVRRFEPGMCLGVGLRVCPEVGLGFSGVRHRVLPRVWPFGWPRGWLVGSTGGWPGVFPRGFPQGWFKVGPGVRLGIQLWFLPMIWL